jgi:hypothetical protein
LRDTRNSPIDFDEGTMWTLSDSVVQG